MIVEAIEKLIRQPRKVEKELWFLPCTCPATAGQFKTIDKPTTCRFQTLTTIFPKDALPDRFSFHPGPLGKLMTGPNDKCSGLSSAIAVLLGNPGWSPSACRFVRRIKTKLWEPTKQLSRISNSAVHCSSLDYEGQLRCLVIN